MKVQIDSMKPVSVSDRAEAPVINLPQPLQSGVSPITWPQLLGSSRTPHLHPFRAQRMLCKVTAVLRKTVTPRYCPPPGQSLLSIRRGLRDPLMKGVLI